MKQATCVVDFPNTEGELQQKTGFCSPSANWNQNQNQSREVCQHIGLEVVKVFR